MLRRGMTVSYQWQMAIATVLPFLSPKPEL
jgi:hypothetical protein